MPLLPWDTYVPAALSRAPMPNFWLEPLAHPHWEKHRKSMLELGYRAIALDFRGNALNAEEVARSFEKSGFNVLEIRDRMPTSSRAWVAWAADPAFLRAAQCESNCRETIWDISALDLRADLLSEMHGEHSLALFLGAHSSEQIAARLTRPWRAPRWIDAWKKSPQTFFAEDFQTICDRRRAAKPRWSIIVPARRRAPQLHYTLMALAAMEVALDSWELILLDDNEPNDFCQTAAFPQLPLLHIRVPRPPETEPNATHFRAASMRNLGARYARGDRFLFLDSDILLRPKFLQKLEENFLDRALHQPCRWNLKPDLDLRELPAASLCVDRHTVLSYRGAWEDIQYSNLDWHEQKFPWQWASSFCLALSRGYFRELGGFRESFDQYGFEDTELGFRAWLRGGKFQRIKEEVFHQSHAKEPGSFDREARKKSYENFFRWVLDPAVHAEYKSKWN